LRNLWDVSPIFKEGLEHFVTRYGWKFGIVTRNLYCLFGSIDPPDQNLKLAALGASAIINSSEIIAYILNRL
jgi:hypothetical protein